MAEPAVIERDEEAVRVFHWRVRRCVALGFTLRQARRIANGPSGWHEAETLLERGCPAETVVRLLSGP
jgi:hypothetical protein